MDVDALAAVAGNTLVTVVVTDACETVRTKVARMFGRGKPDAGIERRLDTTRQQLSAAVAREIEIVRSNLAGQWQTRFADLLADHPEAVAELRALIAEFRPAADACGDVMNTITGSVLNGPVLMGRAFGDVTIDSALHPPTAP